MLNVHGYETIHRVFLPHNLPDPNGLRLRPVFFRNSSGLFLQLCYKQIPLSQTQSKCDFLLFSGARPGLATPPGRTAPARPRPRETRAPSPSPAAGLRPGPGPRPSRPPRTPGPACWGRGVPP